MGDLMNLLQEAANSRRKSGFRYKEKHRLLLMNAAYALKQLVQRLDTFENRERLM